MLLSKLLSYWDDISVHKSLHHRVKKTLMIRGSTINLKVRTARVKIVTKYPCAAYQCNFDNTIQCSRVADLQWQITWCESTFNHLRGFAFIKRHHWLSQNQSEMPWAIISPWVHQMMRDHPFATPSCHGWNGKAVSPGNLAALLNKFLVLDHTHCKLIRDVWLCNKLISNKTFIITVALGNSASCVCMLIMTFCKYTKSAFISFDFDFRRWISDTVYCILEVCWLFL